MKVSHTQHNILAILIHILFTKVEQVDILIASIKLSTKANRSSQFCVCTVSDQALTLLTTLSYENLCFITQEIVYAVSPKCQEEVLKT